VEMSSDFAQRLELLPKLLHNLMESQPISFPLPKAAGIYLLSEGDNHLYVGRTNDVRRRYRNHTTASAGHNQATFAFRIAREETGKNKAAYTRAGSRSALLLDPAFSATFERAKLRVQRMHMRFILLGIPFNRHS
jgi:hypothetical protein